MTSPAKPPQRPRRATKAPPPTTDTPRPPAAPVGRFPWDRGVPGVARTPVTRDSMVGMAVAAMVARMRQSPELRFPNTTEFFPVHQGVPGYGNPVEYQEQHCPYVGGVVYLRRVPALAYSPTGRTDSVHGELVVGVPLEWCIVSTMLAGARVWRWTLLVASVAGVEIPVGVTITDAEVYYVEDCKPLDGLWNVHKDGR